MQGGYMTRMEHYFVRMEHYFVNGLVVLLSFAPALSFADTVGAGIGATTGSSTVTSTSQQPEDSHMSGTANIGNASSNGPVISTTTPSTEGMVSRDNNKSVDSSMDKN